MNWHGAPKHCCITFMPLLVFAPLASQVSDCRTSPQKVKIKPARDPKQCYGAFFVGNSGCQVRARISASGSCSTTSARCLWQDLRISSKISVCGSLVQDLSFQISAPRSCSRATCARSLYEDLLCKMSASGSLYQEPLGPLVQDHCMRISCTRCLRQDLLSRIL